MEKYLNKLLEIKLKDDVNLKAKLIRILKDGKAFEMMDINDGSIRTITFPEIDELYIITEKGPKATEKSKSGAKENSANSVILNESQTEIKGEINKTDLLISELRRVGPSMNQFCAVVASNVENFLTANFQIKKIGIIIKDDLIGGKISFCLARSFHNSVKLDVCFLGEKTGEFSEDIFFFENEGIPINKRFKGVYDLIIVSSKRRIKGFNQINSKTFVFLGDKNEEDEKRNSFVFKYGLDKETNEKNGLTSKFVYFDGNLAKSTNEKYKILKEFGQKYYFI